MSGDKRERSDDDDDAAAAVVGGKRARAAPLVAAADVTLHFAEDDSELVVPRSAVACLPFFRTAFASGMREERTGRVEITCDHDGAAVRAVVAYVRSGPPRRWAKEALASTDAVLAIAREITFLWPPVPDAAELSGDVTEDRWGSDAYELMEDGYKHMQFDSADGSADWILERALCRAKRANSLYQKRPRALFVRETPESDER
ncbi:hypothetical protein LCGC14_2034290, partial [marine sediment metagenome]